MYHFEEKTIFMCLVNSKPYLRLCPLQSMNCSPCLIAQVILKYCDLTSRSTFSDKRMLRILCDLQFYDVSGNIHVRTLQCRAVADV